MPVMDGWELNADMSCCRSPRMETIIITAMVTEDISEVDDSMRQSLGP